MAYFEDLSFYRYLETSHAKNIGWLDREYPFQTGKVSAIFLERLEALTEVSVNSTRGIHIPNLGDKNEIIYHETDKGRYILGDAEIRVFAENGDIFAAPNLLLHYVKEYDYLPPKAFIDAVMNMPVPPSKEYFENLERLNIDWSKKLG